MSYLTAERSADGYQETCVSFLHWLVNNIVAGPVSCPRLPVKVTERFSKCFAAPLLFRIACLVSRLRLELSAAGVLAAVQLSVLCSS